MPSIRFGPPLLGWRTDGPGDPSTRTVGDDGGVIGVVVPVPVRWSDMDAFGHVNNVAVLRLMEEARIEALAGLASPGVPSMLDTGVIVARHEVEYRQQLLWRREAVPVHLWVTGVGGASFELAYAVGGGEGGFDAGHDGAPTGAAVTSLAVTTVVAMDAGSGRPRRLSAHERSVLERWTGDPVPFRARAAAPPR